MRIDRLEPVGFGRWQGRAIELLPGLNLLEGHNESGKSTLQEFIFSMLYGIVKPGMRRYKREAFERYQPWQGTEYRGHLVYTHQDQQYLVERSFEPHQLTIRNALTNAVLNDCFREDARRELDFAEQHLGLPAPVFRNTLWIGQRQAQPGEDLAEQVRELLANLGSEEDQLAGPAIELLQAEADELGTGRSTTRPLDKLQAQIEELEAERQRAANHQQALRGLQAELRQASSRVEELAAQAKQASTECKQLEAQSLQQRLADIERLQGRVEELQKELDANRRYLEFPASEAAAVERHRGRLETVRSLLEPLETQVEQLQAQTRELDQPSGLEARLVEVPSHVIEDQRFNLRRWREQAAALAEASQEAGEAARAVDALEQERSTYRPCEQLQARLGQHPIDWYQDHSTRRQELRGASHSEDLQEVQSQQAERKQRAQHQKTGSWLAGGLALLAVLAALLFSPLAWAAAVILAAGAIYLHRTAAATRGRVQEDARALAQQQAAEAGRQQELQRVEAALQEVEQQLGVSGLAGLRQLWQRYQQWQQDLDRARDRAGMAEQQEQRLADQVKDLQQQVSGWLAGFGRQVDSLEEASTALDDLYRQWTAVKEAQDGRQRLEQQLTEKRQQLAAHQAELAGLEERLASIFEAAGAADHQEFQEGLAAHERAREIQNTLAQQKELLQAAKAGREVQEWQADLEALGVDLDSSETASEIAAAQELQPSGTTEGGAGVAGSSANPSQNLDQARRRLAGIKNELASARTHWERLRTQLDERESQHRSLVEIEEELERARRHRDHLQSEQEAIRAAAALLDDITRSLQHQFAPALNDRLSSLLASVTGDRYARARVTNDLEITVFDEDSQRWVAAGALSSGAQDQLYLALRLAIGQLVCPDREVPLIMDEALVQFDDQRHRSALEFLAELSKERQVIVFTCQRREREVLEQSGLDFNLIEI